MPRTLKAQNLDVEVDCSSHQYACSKCRYEFDDNRLNGTTYIVYSDGDEVILVHNESASFIRGIGSGFSYMELGTKGFLTNDEKKLSCPSNIYVYLTDELKNGGAAYVGATSGLSSLAHFIE